MLLPFQLIETLIYYLFKISLLITSKIYKSYSRSFRSRSCRSPYTTLRLGQFIMMLMWMF